MSSRLPAISTPRLARLMAVMQEVEQSQWDEDNEDPQICGKCQHRAQQHPGDKNGQAGPGGEPMEQVIDFTTRPPSSGTTGSRLNRLINAIHAAAAARAPLWL